MKIDTLIKSNYLPTYNTVMNALAKSVELGAAIKRAKAILLSLQEQCYKGSIDIKPNKHRK
jgi:hypothetical protein